MGSFIVLALVGLVVLAAMTYYGHTKANEAWKQAAAQLGFQYFPPSSAISSDAQMVGEINDFHLRVHLEVRRHGDDRTTYTIYTLTFPVAGPDVSLRRESQAMGFFKSLIGIKDVHVGDPNFDRAVKIDAPDPMLAAQFLTPARKMAALSLFEAYPKAQISSGGIELSDHNRESDADRLVGAVHRLVDTAAVFAAPGQVDRALELEAEGDLAAGADVLAEVVEAEPNDYTRLLEAEARVALGEHERAAELLHEVTDHWPQDQEAAGWQRVAETRAPEPPAEPVSLDANAVIEDLFAKNRPSYEVEERFASVYRDKAVTWSGTIDRVNTFRSDRDFGNTPGHKAIIDIGHLGDGRLVSDQIDAIVGFPTDLTLERGAAVTFSGTLLRVDRFMRNIYVADATILTHDQP